MRIFVESTKNFLNSEQNVGIPRVVRNVVFNLSGIQEVECVPIVFRHSRYYDARGSIDMVEPTKRINKTFAYLTAKVEELWRMYDRMCAKKVISSTPILQKVLLGVFVIGGQPLMTAFRICRTLRIRRMSKWLIPIDIQPGDIVLWPGSLEGKSIQRRLTPLKLQGARIIAIIHDLFLITQFVIRRDSKQKVIPSPWLLSTADGFIAVSATVRDELREYLRSNLQIPEKKLPWTDYFHLGSELDLVTSQTQLRSFFRKHFNNSSSSYLMVGTVQPRKNYAYALDAFELLWADNVNVTLCIVGAIGWKCEELVERIHKHPEWNRRLFMWNDTNDTELEYCYRHSKALVFSAIAEGFGLPLVEAMQHGLPVMASDIPIFRELGTDFVAFFELSNPQNLCDLIIEFEKSAVFPAVRSIEEWQWISWEESTLQLIEKIVQHEKEHSDGNPIKLKTHILNGETSTISYRNIAICKHL